MKGAIKYIFWIFYTIIFISCSKIDENKSKKVFNINLDQGLTSLDPAFARNQNAIWMTNQIFNGLVQIDSALNIVPCIAKSWQVSADALTYTFK